MTDTTLVPLSQLELRAIYGLIRHLSETSPEPYNELQAAMLMPDAERNAAQAGEDDYDEDLDPVVSTYESLTHKCLVGLK